MAMFASANAGLTPPDYGPLIVQPVQRDSIAYQLSTLITTDRTSTHLPQVTADPAAGWYSEGDTITPADGTTAELVVTPKKVAGLTKLSREFADDSNPQAAQVIGDGLARDIVSKVDAAYFANTTSKGPSGLLSLTTSVVDTGASIANLDPFVEAISKAEDLGAKLGAFVVKPATAQALGKLKQLTTGSNMPLLTPDPADPLRRTILGVPLLVSSAVDANTFAWGVPKSASYVIQRGGAEVEVDSSIYFDSYSVAVRAVMRVGFGFVYPLAIVRLYDAP